MNKHTPGPWKFDAGNCLKAGERGMHLGTFYESAGLGAHANANRALIESAPDLLAALREIDTIARGHPYAGCTCGDIARAAIARAEGKQ